MRTKQIALASAVVGALSLAPTQLSPADASMSAKAATAVGAESVSTTTFIVYPTTTSNGANPNGVALGLSHTSSSQTFFVRNTGAKNLNSFVFSVASAPTANFTYKNCPINTTFSSATKCSDGSTAPSVSAGTVGIALPAGSYIEIQLTPDKSTTPTVTAQASASNYTNKVTNS